MPELKNKFFANMFPLLGKGDIILCRRVMKEASGAISYCESANDIRQIDEAIPSYERAFYMHGMQYICGSLFRRNLIINHIIRFIPGMEPNEDIIFGVIAGYYANSIISSYDSVYGYNSRPDSMTNQEGEKARMYKLIQYGNRQFPLLLSYLLLRDAKHNELCSFVSVFRNILRRFDSFLFIQGKEFYRFSSAGAFPEMCLNCKLIKEVCSGAASCPNTSEFEQFIRESATQFMPIDFNLIK